MRIITVFSISSFGQRGVQIVLIWVHVKFRFLFKYIIISPLINPACMFCYGKYVSINNVYRIRVIFLRMVRESYASLICMG